MHAGSTRMLNDWDDDEWQEFHRTDYEFLANRTIHHTEGEEGTTSLVWQDPYMYQIAYDFVGNNGANVYGTTTITVLEKDGKFRERRGEERIGRRQRESATSWQIIY